MLKKVVVAVSPAGVVGVAVLVPGVGPCVLPVTDPNALKHALRYSNCGSDCAAIRRKISSLSALGFKCRIEKENANVVNPS